MPCLTNLILILKNLNSIIKTELRNLTILKKRLVFMWGRQFQSFCHLKHGKQREAKVCSVLLFGNQTVSRCMHELTYYCTLYDIMVYIEEKSISIHLANSLSSLKLDSWYPVWLMSLLK